MIQNSPRHDVAAKFYQSIVQPSPLAPWPLGLGKGGYSLLEDFILRITGRSVRIIHVMPDAILPQGTSDCFLLIYLDPARHRRTVIGCDLEARTATEAVERISSIVSDILDSFELDEVWGISLSPTDPVGDGEPVYEITTSCEGIPIRVWIVNGQAYCAMDL